MALGHGRPLTPFAFFQPQDLQDAPQSFPPQSTGYRYQDRSPWLKGSAVLFVAAAALFPAVVQADPRPQFVQSIIEQAKFQPQPLISNTFIAQFQPTPLRSTWVARGQESKEFLEPSIYPSFVAGLEKPPLRPAIVTRAQDSKEYLQPFVTEVLIAQLQPTPLRPTFIARQQESKEYLGPTIHPSFVAGLEKTPLRPSIYARQQDSKEQFPPVILKPGLGQPVPQIGQYGYGTQSTLVASRSTGTIWPALVQHLTPTPLRPIISASEQRANVQPPATINTQQPTPFVAPSQPFGLLTFSTPQVPPALQPTLAVTLIAQFQPTPLRPITITTPQESTVPSPSFVTKVLVAQFQPTPLRSMPPVRSQDSLEQRPAVVFNTFIAQFQPTPLRPTLITPPQESKVQSPSFVTPVLIAQFQPTPNRPIIMTRAQESTEQRPAQIMTPFLGQVPPSPQGAHYSYGPQAVLVANRSIGTVWPAVLQPSTPTPLRPTMVTPPQESKVQSPSFITSVLIAQLQPTPLRPTLQVRGQDDTVQPPASFAAPLQVPPFQTPPFRLAEIASPQIPPTLQPSVTHVLIQQFQPTPMRPIIYARVQDSKEQFPPILIQPGLGRPIPQPGQFGYGTQAYYVASRSTATLFSQQPPSVAPTPTPNRPSIITRGQDQDSAFSQYLLPLIWQAPPPSITPVPPSGIFYQGDGKKHRKLRRKNATYELYALLRETMAEQLQGVPLPTILVAPSEPTITLDLSQGLQEAIARLAQRAKTYEDLAFRIRQLQKGLDEHQARSWQAFLEDDDDTFFWL